MWCSCCCFSSFITCRTFLRELENCAEKPELVGTCFLKRVSSQQTVTDSNGTRIRSVLQRCFHFVTSHFYSGVYSIWRYLISDMQIRIIKWVYWHSRNGCDVIVWGDSTWKKFHLVTSCRFLDTQNNMKFIQEEVQLMKQKALYFFINREL